MVGLPERVQTYLAEQELEQIGENIIVPTNDIEVQNALKVFQEIPRLSEGERNDERRRRLTRVMALRKQKGLSLEWKTVAEPEYDEPMVEFWTDASPNLQQARCEIAETTNRLAESRLLAQRERKAEYDSNVSLWIHNALKSREDLVSSASKLRLFGTQVGFGRPVSSVRFHKNYLVAGDWSGKITLLDAQSLEVQKTLPHAHEGKVGGLAWNRDGVLASGGVEGDVKLHEFTSMSGSTLKGHSSRVAQVEWHPLGRYLASSSYDNTWRLWDAEKELSLLEQEGHSREVHGLAFHPDGSLVVTGGHDAIGRVWDLRSGRTVMILDRHIREIYACACSPNGYDVATGGADGSIFIWDLRKAGPTFEIPAHTNIISGLRFSENGYLASSSYAAELRLWSSLDWRLLRTLRGQEKIMALDVTHDFQITCGNWNRTLDLYRLI